MTMGQRILAARQAAGLSQRELAGEEITRNMLSALEHDCANPSVATLKYLSQKLDRPVSYFLGEDVPQIPEYPQLEEARRAYDAGEYRRCLELLEEIPQPGAVLDREVSLLRTLAAMELAEEMIAQGRLPYARELLNRAARAGAECPYFGSPEQAWLAVLRARAGEPGELPDVDEVLLLRAERERDAGAALTLLNAVRDQDSTRCAALRGKTYFGLGAYREAAACFHRIEDQTDVRRELEDCYRELGDYKMAYYYAKK